MVNQPMYFDRSEAAYKPIPTKVYLHVIHGDTYYIHHTIGFVVGVSNNDLKWTATDAKTGLSLGRRFATLQGAHDWLSAVIPTIQPQLKQARAAFFTTPIGVTYTPMHMIA